MAGASQEAILEYMGADRLDGPLLFIEGASDVGFDEVAEVIAPDGSTRLAQVLEVDRDRAVLQMLGDSEGLVPGTLRARFRGRPMRAPVGRDMLGRVFDGLGTPRDGLPPPVVEDQVPVQGSALNPSARAYPEAHIVTGVSAIDAMNTLVRGQKLPIFSGAGLPHNDLAAQIARQAQTSGDNGGESFAVVFVALGVSHDVAREFERSLTETVSASSVALFLSLADDPTIERTVTPHVALSLAEFLAFEHEMHVLVILTDMTNYGEAMREVSARREEVPTRKGFPGHLYSDLASIYERCGMASGRGGSVTQMPVLTMPNDDITHPIPDLTGYITEGQIVLSRRLRSEGVYPPINVLQSLSRLMKDAIGQGKTRPDHPDLANQLYAAYARAQDVRDMAEIIGEDELSDIDRRHLAFGESFERQFMAQGQREARTMSHTLDLAWSALGELPTDALTRLSKRAIKEHCPGDGVSEPTEEG